MFCWGSCSSLGLEVGLSAASVGVVRMTTFSVGCFFASGFLAYVFLPAFLLLFLAEISTLEPSCLFCSFNLFDAFKK